MRRQIIENPAFCPVDWPPRNPATHETDMTTTARELDAEKAVFMRHQRNINKRHGGQKRIVEGAEQEGGKANGIEELPCARPGVVVSRIIEAVHWCSDRIVEVEQRPGVQKLFNVEQIRVPGQFCECLSAQRTEKVPGVDAGESPLDATGAEFEVERGGDGCCGLELSGKVCAPLAEPFEQHVTAEREPGQHEWALGILPNEAMDDHVEIGGFARMVKSGTARHGPVASPEDQDVGGPAEFLRPSQHTAKVVGADRPLEAVQEEQPRDGRRRVRAGGEPPDLYLVAIRRCPPLHTCRYFPRPTDEFSPERLEMRARHPPRGDERTGYIGGHRHGTWTVGGRSPPGGRHGLIDAREGALAPSYYINLARMDVQIFGLKRSADTRKAQRFFSERRVRIHFVDLQEKAASRGELQRFVQKFGVRALIDESSKRYAELGLRTALYGDERWLAILVDEPMLLKMPLVRRGNALTIGAAEITWKSWLAT